MSVIQIILTVIYVLLGVAISIVVLMQEGKSNGLGSAIGGMADSYWSKNKGRSMESKMKKWTAISLIVLGVLSIVFYILQFRKVDLNTLEGRRRLIDSFVNSVVVYDDYLLVTFNYKEGAERITFDQIERSDLSSLGRPQASEIG